MKNLFRVILLFVSCTLLTSHTTHKFYVAIHQLQYVKEKKMLQVTSRIFVDDLNDILKKNYKVETHIADPSETEQDRMLMKKYLLENFRISINGKEVPLQFHSKELDNNVLICYMSCREISKISTLGVSNKILFDLVTEQQNIIQTQVNGEKQNLLLTQDNPSGTLKF